jgi:hypothetical protein
VRLTALLGHDCAGFPGFEDGELTVMSNTTDPLLTRYKDAGGTIFDVFGTSDSSGQSVSSDGVLAVTPADDNVRMTFDEGSGTYEMVNQKNGTRFIYREDADGNRFLTVIDPVTGTSVTVPLEADDDPDTQGDTRSKLAAQLPMRAAAGDDAVPQADGDGQLAEVVVQQCGGPTAAAKVDFIAGDRSVPGATPTNSSFQVEEVLVVPADVVGTGSQQRYQARIPVAGPEFSQAALDARCARLPDGPRNFCQVSQADDDYCSALIGGDQGGFAGISPEDRLRLFAACQANRAVAQQFCVTHEAKAATQCASVDYESSYREVPADLWAGASLEGVTPVPQYTAPQTIDPNATGYAFEDIVLPDRATLIDAFTSPATVQAGSGYQAFVYASCLAAGTQLTGTRPSTQEQFTCQVDSSGRCILDVPATASGASVDAIQVTGPNQFLARLTVPLAPPPDVSNDLTGDWLVTETVTYETCGDGLYTETFSVTLIQEGSTVALCEGGLCVDGVLDGDVVSWSYSYFEHGGMTSTDVVMNVSPDGQSLSGEGAWSWTDGVFSCEGETTLTAERL